MVVKQLTKKNCEQIGAKYVGPSKFGGVIYNELARKMPP